MSQVKVIMASQPTSGIALDISITFTEQIGIIGKYLRSLKCLHSDKVVLNRGLDKPVLWDELGMCPGDCLLDLENTYL